MLGKGDATPKYGMVAWLDELGAPESAGLEAIFKKEFDHPIPCYGAHLVARGDIIFVQFAGAGLAGRDWVSAADEVRL